MEAPKCESYYTIFVLLCWLCCHSIDQLGLFHFSNICAYIYIYIYHSESICWSICSQVHTCRVDYSRRNMPLFILNQFKQLITNMLNKKICITSFWYPGLDLPILSHTPTYFWRNCKCMWLDGWAKYGLWMELADRMSRVGLYWLTIFFGSIQYKTASRVLLTLF